MNAEQRVQRAYATLLRNPELRWMSTILILGKWEISEQIPTAATDGRNCLYNPQFVLSLTDPELRGLILHENYHKMFKHMLVWQHLYKTNGMIANMACDYAINLRIDDLAKSVGSVENHSFIKLPDYALLDEKYRGWDEAAIFYDLLDKQKEGGQGQPLDTHNWEAAEGLTQQEKATQNQEIDTAIRQGNKLAGKTGSPLAGEEVGELTKPQIDWRAALQDFVKTCSRGKGFGTWSRPNRRYIGSGVYMPSVISETAGEGLLAVDRSGSVYGCLMQFLSELVDICQTVKPELTHVAYWDTEVSGFETYAQEELERILTTTEPKGGGGTDATCLPNYLREKAISPQFAVVFTDGYVSNWGQWECPVLWCILDNKNAVPPMGKVLHINPTQLR